MSLWTLTRNLDPESVGATRWEPGRRLAASGTGGGEAAQLRILRARQNACWRGVASAAKGAPAMPLQGTAVHDTRPLESSEAGAGNNPLQGAVVHDTRPLESPKVTTVRH